MISGAIVYSKTYGLTKLIRQLLTWTPLVGVIYYLLNDKNPVDNSVTFGLLTGPLVTGLLYELFEMLSAKDWNNKVLLLMRSGNFDGKNLDQFGRDLIK